MKMKKIITVNDPPPIPLRDFDWCALRDDYEPGDPLGHGLSESAAVSDLLTKEQEKEVGSEVY